TNSRPLRNNSTLTFAASCDGTSCLRPEARFGWDGPSRQGGIQPPRCTDWQIYSAFPISKTSGCGICNQRFGCPQLLRTNPLTFLKRAGQPACQNSASGGTTTRSTMKSSQLKSPTSISLGAERG